jgi:hypothetical protein
MKRTLLALLLAALPGLAHGAVQTPTSVTVTPQVVSTSAACNPPGSFAAPVPAGMPICQIVVTPAGGVYTYSLSGTAASQFGIMSGSSGTWLVVGSTPINTTVSETLIPVINVAP